MVINIVGGGPAELLPDLHLYNDEDCIWVGVDKGVFVLLKNGIVPTAGFGDFDSVTVKEWDEIEQTVTGLSRFKPEKDETDMELALSWALKQAAKTIHIFGGTGGRLDHFLANVQLLLQPVLQKLETEVFIIDKKNILNAKASGTHSLHKNPNRKYISFIPITEMVKNLSLNGFKYPLTNRHIPLGSTLCISNELNKDYGTFSFTEGILLVIRSCD